MDAIWGDEPPPAADSALSALVSKLRNAVNPSPGAQAVYQRLLALSGDDA
jgi:hypothetical protein